MSRRPSRNPCPIARTNDLIGDRWSPVILREAFLGRRRFDEFQDALRVSRAVLTQRLNRLVDEGMLEKVAYQERPPRYEYRLTEKGHAFYDVLGAMWRFGSDWMWGDKGPAVELANRETGEVIRPVLVDEATGERVDPRKIRMQLKSRRD